MQRWGVSPAELAHEAQARQVAVRAQNQAGEVIEVPAPLWPLVCLFNACRTQWRMVATPGGLLCLGLDYSAVAAAAAMLGLALKAHQFGWLRTMEAEALRVFNRDAAAGSPP